MGRLSLMRALALALFVSFTWHTGGSVVRPPRSQVHLAPRMDKDAITLPAGDPDWIRRPYPTFATPRGRSDDPVFKATTIETRDLVHRPPLKRNQPAPKDQGQDAKP